MPDATDLPATTDGLLVRPALELAKLVRSGEVGAWELVEAPFVASKSARTA